MTQTSVAHQVGALLKKNFIIKKRSRKQTIQEFLFPIYFLVILALIRMGIPKSTEPPVPHFDEHPLDQSRFYGALVNATLYVSPNTTEVQQLSQELTSLLQANYSTLVTTELFASGSESLKAYQANGSLALIIGLDFSDGTLTQGLNYSLRFPYGKTADTKSLYGSQGQCREASGLGVCLGTTYLHQGFAWLQNVLNTLLIQHTSGSSDFAVPQVKVQQFPKAAWNANSSYLQVISSIYLVIAYSPFISFLMVNLVSEKEKKIKEGMRMMGMKDSAFWLSWGIIYAAIILVVTVVCTLIAYGVQLFQNSNIFLFFLMMFLYGLSIITLSFMLTPFFSKAETAGSLSSLATIVFSLLSLSVTLTRSAADGRSTIPPYGQWWLCLLSPVALALAVDQALYLDLRGGMTFATATSGAFPLYAPMVMLAVDFVLYGLLAVYLDNVVPTEFGQRRHPLFCLMPSYWRSRGSQPITGQDPPEVSALPQDIDFEEVSPHFRDKNALRIKNITKSFGSGKKKVWAVDGITLDIYEGQITALLGHNGAGKTTLLNMLTGLSPPTTGSATLYGLNVSDPNDMNEIRSMVGICPQHNILFDLMTCTEHLQLYGCLKGVPANEVDDLIRKALDDVSLQEKKDTWAKNLSGGQKRKLSVAIALIGDPKVIFLDEPTAGMDAYSRRHLWTLLKNQRQGRIILLTTHFMDEADILADRKAIISKGSLKCVGSSLFLKNRFGLGYHLSLVINPDQLEMVTDQVHKHLPEARLGRIHGNEMMFLLPPDSMDRFPDLFNSIETAISDGAMGIKAYGISMTTLEEVFLRIGIDEQSTEDDQTAPPNRDGTEKIPLLDGSANTGAVHVDMAAAGTSSQPPQNAAAQPQPAALDPSKLYTHSEDTPLRSQQFWAIFKVRFLMVRRNKPTFVFRFIMPVLFLIIAMAVAKFTGSSLSVEEPSPLALSPSLYARMLHHSSAARHPNMTLQVSPPFGNNVTLDGFVKNLESIGVGTTRIGDNTDLLNMQPHHIGVHTYSLKGTGQNVAVDATAVFNDTAVHSLPVSLGLIANSLLGTVTGNTPSAGGDITVTTDPWPNLNPIRVGFQAAMFTSVLLVGLAMVSVPSAMAITLVKDRQVKAKSQLRVAGVSLGVYWGSSFFTDFITYFIVAVASVVILLAFQVEGLVYPGAVVAIILLYLVAMPSLMLFAYNVSFGFDKFETAQSIVPNVFSILSFLPYVPVALMDMMGEQTIASYVHYALVILDPPYLIFGGLYYINKVYITAVIGQLTFTPVISFGVYFKFDSNVIICYLAALLHVVIFFFGLRFLESRKSGASAATVFGCGDRKAKVVGIPESNDDIPEAEERDVMAERQAVEGWTEDSDNKPVAMLKNLRKEFKKDSAGPFAGCFKKGGSSENVMVAVSNNSLMVGRGEVLGLLGPNGAGKTTTMNMIVGEEKPTRGRVYLAGVDVLANPFEASQALGYCPQADALWDDITLREHLECYAAIRGIPKQDLQAVSNYFLQSLNIEEHSEKISKNLSGGTKRKLSYSISMLGQPSVVLMDEPSTGMDPRSKRFLWDTIVATFSPASDKGAVLTTHYMEEADALCSRVAIMINGSLKCIGSTQHLKNIYGTGYSLEVKLMEASEAGQDEAEEDAMQAKLQAFVLDLFPTAVKGESFGQRVTYKIPQEGIGTLSGVFAALRDNKEDLKIEEYSFSQATLEQVFLEFAKKQHESEGKLTAKTSHPRGQSNSSNV